MEKSNIDNLLEKVTNSIVNLELGHCIFDSKINKILNPEKHYENIKKIYIHNSQYNVTINIPLKNIFDKCKNLETLHLDINKIHIDTRNIDQIPPNLKKLKLVNFDDYNFLKINSNIEILQLDHYSGPNLKSFYTLSEILKNNERLKHLETGDSVHISIDEDIFISESISTIVINSLIVNIDLENVKPDMKDIIFMMIKKLKKIFSRDYKLKRVNPNHVNLIFNIMKKVKVKISLYHNKEPQFKLYNPQNKTFNLSSAIDRL